MGFPEAGGRFDLKNHRPEIVYFGGLGGPGGPKNPPRRWGASTPTFWNGFWGPPGPPRPQNRGISDQLLFFIFRPPSAQHRAILRMPDGLLAAEDQGQDDEDPALEQLELTPTETA